MRPIRILLADDHALMRQAVRTLLGTEPDLEVVGEAAGGDEALALAVELQPDVVLMDLSMDAGGGIEATRAIAALSRARVMVFSLHAEEMGMLGAVRAGACGYLPKTAPPDDLLHAIRRVARGEMALSPHAMQVLLRAVAPCHPATTDAG